MKYIKKFNENVSNELEGLSEFLDDYFVEFSDMGFVIDSEYQIGFDGNVWLDINKKDDLSFILEEKLSEILDKKDPIKDNYFLEVSSPGLDRPLKKDKDFERYKGRDVEIKLYKPMNGSKQFEGELVGLTEDNNIKVIIDGEEVDFTRKEVALIRLAIKF